MVFIVYMFKNLVLLYILFLYDLDFFLVEYGEVCFFVGFIVKEFFKGKYELSKWDVEVLVRWLLRDC